MAGARRARAPLKTGWVKEGLASMRRTATQLPPCLLLLACLVLVSCGDSTGPVDDTTPPVAGLSLSVGERNSTCPVAAFFSINPMGSSDDRTDRDDIRIRWDFENDGLWDTGYGTLAVTTCHPDPLPVEHWSVRCELSDMAGNTVVHVETIELPAWLPEPPDIIAGWIELQVEFPVRARVDTLVAGQDFTIMAWRRDWATPEGQPVRTAFFVDDVEVHETGSLTTYPDPLGCFGLGFVVAGGITTPGIHEIRVVEDVRQDIAETNENNNITSCEVVVVE